MAWSEETGTCLATNGYLLIQAARIELLAGNFGDAEELFSLARDSFKSAGLAEPVNELDDMAASLLAYQARSSQSK